MKIKERFVQNLQRISPYLPEGIEPAFSSQQTTSYPPIKISKDPKTQVIFLYKLGDGFCLNSLKKWLQKKKNYLLLIEEEVEDLSIFLQSPFSEELVNHPRVHFCFLQAPWEEKIKKMLWQFALLPKEIFCHPHYQKSHEKRFFQIKRCFEENQLGIDMVASEMSDMGLSLYQNVYVNLFSLSSYRLMSDLKGAFFQKPAILIGAGASLKKSLPLLQKLQDKVLFFAAGTAIEALESYGIYPHFSASIDKQAEEKRGEGAFSLFTSFFFQLRSQVSMVEKPYLNKWLCPDHPYYPLQNYLYQQLKEITFCESGWNVATFLLQQMLYLGCSPIFLVGVDLCFSPKKYYAHTQENPKEEAWIPTYNLQGEKRYTKKDFLLAAKWIEKLALDYPNQIWNLGKEGIGFQGVENISIEEAEKKLCASFFEVEGWIHSYQIQRPLYSWSSSQGNKLLNQIEASFSSCLELCQRDLCFFEKNFGRLLGKKHFFDAFLYTAWEREIAYRDHLQPFWEIWKHTFLRDTDSQDPLPFSVKEWLKKLLFFQEMAQKHLNLCKQVRTIYGKDSL